MTTVALDSNILIYILDDASPFSKPAQELLKRLESTEASVYLSTVARTEILHRPYQVSVEIGDKTKQFLSSFGFISFVSVSEEIADKAAELCAKVGAKLKSIDSIHLATALDSGATEFWTNDHELLKVQIHGLVIKSLDDIK
jgi:predicted nucleic acid-binding protein